MKQKKQWSIDFLHNKKSKLGKVKRSKYAPDAPGVTYRHAQGLRRLANGQLVSTVDKLRGIVRGKKRKEYRRLLREEQQLLEIEKGME